MGNGLNAEKRWETKERMSCRLCGESEESLKHAQMSANLQKKDDGEL